MDRLKLSDFLKEKIDNLFTSPEYRNAVWGAYARILGSKEVLYSLNSEKLFVPASNMKLVTAWAGLRLLGSQYKYRTRLLRIGKIIDRTLKGSLLVVGSGDPTFGSTAIGESSPTPFDTWCNTMANMGIGIIEKNIIADDSAFDTERYGKGWEWEDLGKKYAPPVGGLQYADNLLRISVYPASKIDEKAILKISPELTYFRIQNFTKTSSNTKERRVLFKKHLGIEGGRLDGYVHLGSDPITLEAAVTNPSRFFVEALRLTMRQKGLVNTPKIKIGKFGNNKKVDAEEIAVHESLSIGKIVEIMLKSSNNLFAETIFKTLGLECAGEGSGPAGINVVRQFLLDLKLGEEPFFIADGSGLSRQNLLAPRTIVELLSVVEREPDFLAIRNALPCGGVDGTLKNRFKESPLLGKVFAKTGTMRGVSALSGYIELGSRMIVFSILVNNFTASLKTIEILQEEFCHILSRYSQNDD